MNQIGQLIFFAIVAAIIYVLVRPGSIGAQSVVAIGAAIAAVVATATGFPQKG